jgi:hypothetical protein
LGLLKRTHVHTANEPQYGGCEHEENMQMFGELRLLGTLTDEQIAAMRDPRLARTVRRPTIEGAVKAGGFSGEPGRRPSSRQGRRRAALHRVAPVDKGCLPSR